MAANASFYTTSYMIFSPPPLSPPHTAPTAPPSLPPNPNAGLFLALHADPHTVVAGVPGEHLDEGGVDSVSLRHVGAGEAVVPELETDIPAGLGDGGGDPGVQDGVVGLEDLGEDDGLSLVCEAGDGVPISLY